MWPHIVVEGNPVTEHTAGVLDGFKAVTMHALLLNRADQSFDHAVLLRAMRSNELLLQPVAFDQCGVAAGGEDQPIIGSKQERRVDFAQRAVPADQCLFQGCFGGSGSARAGKMPTQELSRMAVHDDG